MKKTTITCTDVERVVQRGLDGRASPDERTALDRHLQSCAACRELADSLDRTRTLLAELGSENRRREAPEGFADRVRESIHGDRFRTTIWFEVLPTIRRLSVAALVLVVVGLGLSPILGGRSASRESLHVLAARSLAPVDRYLMAPVEPVAGGRGVVLDLIRAR